MPILETSVLLYWDRNGLRSLSLCKLDDDVDDDHDDDRQHVKLKKASPRSNECTLYRYYNRLHTKTEELSITNVQHQMLVTSTVAARRAGTMY
jgi:hypothetical protein